MVWIIISILIACLIVCCFDFTFEDLIGWHYTLAAVAFEPTVAELTKLGIAALVGAEKESGCLRFDSLLGRIYDFLCP